MEKVTRRGGHRDRRGAFGKNQRDSKRFNRDRKPAVEFSREPIVTKTTPFGLFVYHEDKQLKKLFWGKNAVNCANRYFIMEDEIKKLNNTIPIKARRVTEGIYGDKLLVFALENGFRDENEFRQFFQEFTLELTKLKIKYGFKKDKLVIQAVSNMDEITKILNIFYERLSEWYGFYFPEAVKRIEDIESFAEIVGRRRTEKSMGYDLEENDIKMIDKAGEEMRCLLRYKNELNYYIEDLMNEIAPNLANAAGPVIGAKLIASAGSLEKLSKMTSSTVQVLGAEKALFRHLRSGARPPKYGIILQHAMMKTVSPNDRGKFARTLSGKLAIAAKVDFNSKGKEKVWKTLIDDLKKRTEFLS